MELRICHMYPDVLNLYGDGGNVLCMKRRLEWRGIDVTVTRLPVGETARFSDADLVFIGGGQDFEQQVILGDLHSTGKAAEVKSAIEDGLPFLVVCGGYQMLGNYYQTADGSKCDFIGALDMYTVGAADRMTGNYMFSCGESSGGGTIVGFENHSGKTFLGSGLNPLGSVITGFGNNGEDGGEGARYKNVFGTYGHGPLLPTNPGFCDFILRTALERRYGSAELAPLDDSAEIRAHDEMVKRLTK